MRQHHWPGDSLQVEVNVLVITKNSARRTRRVSGDSVKPVWQPNHLFSVAFGVPGHEFEDVPDLEGTVTYLNA